MTIVIMVISGFRSHSTEVIRIKTYWGAGAWVAQSVEHLTLAWVMISQFVGSSPASVSVLTAQSLELAFPALAVSTRRQ